MAVNIEHGDTGADWIEGLRPAAENLQAARGGGRGLSLASRLALTSPCSTGG
jgi:hypothetical protein